MTDLDQLVVPDWMRTIPAPVPPTHHVEKACEDKIDYEEDLIEEESDEKEIATAQEDEREDSTAQETAVAMENPKAKEVEQLPADSDDEDQTAFAVVNYTKWMSKEKDPSAPSTKKQYEEKVGGERGLVIKDRQLVTILEETTPALMSKETAKAETAGDPEKAHAPAAPTPVQIRLKTSNNKQGKHVELGEPIQNNYARPGSKVAAKYSEVAVAKEKDKNAKASIPTGTAATNAKLKTEQDAIIRKKKAKSAAVPASLARAVQQKKREAQLEEDRLEAEMYTAYQQDHPEEFVNVPESHDEEDQDPHLPSAFSPVMNSTRLQKAFKTMQKDEGARPVRKCRPETVKGDKKMMWKAVTWAGMAFVALLVWGSYFA